MSYSTTVNIDDGGVTRQWDVAAEVVETEPGTGVATITITPRGGRARLPAVYDGDPGLPPVFDSVTRTVVAPGVTVPQPDLVLVSPGSPGVASHYTLNIYVPKGDTGAADTTILDATDISGTVTAKYYLVVNNTGDGITFAAPKVGGLYVPSSINSTSGNASPRTLASIAVAGQLFAWRPKVSGFVVVGNAADTHVDLLATIGATNGDQVGYGPGITGSTVHPVTLGFAGWGGALGTTGGQYSAGYGVVPAGQATTVFFQAKQTASTTSNWTTPNGGPTAAFALEVSPLP
jgi:hypothetical protein